MNINVVYLPGQFLLQIIAIYVGGATSYTHLRAERLKQVLK